MLLVLPVSYVFLKLGYQPESIFIVQLVIPSNKSNCKTGNDKTDDKFFFK